MKEGYLGPRPCSNKCLVKLMPGLRQPVVLLGLGKHKGLVEGLRLLAVQWGVEKGRGLVVVIGWEIGTGRCQNTKAILGSFG